MKFWKKVNIGSTSLSDKNANQSLFVRWLTMQHRLVYKRFPCQHADINLLLYREWRRINFQRMVITRFTGIFSQHDGRTMTVQCIKTETSSLLLAWTVDLHLFLACCCAEFIINLASGSLRATKCKKWKRTFTKLSQFFYLLHKNVKFIIY